jgi:hypothetical protein
MTREREGAVLSNHDLETGKTNTTIFQENDESKETKALVAAIKTHSGVSP